jgi:Fe-S cluster assembly iron-binding protein IscA
MLEVTEKAAEMIKQFQQNQTGSDTFRIILHDEGKRPFFRMYFVEPGENDTIVTEQGITFAIDRRLLDLAKPIRIDYAEIDEEHAGFQIISRLPMVGWKTR